MNKNSIKLTGGTKFLLVMISIYIIAYFLDSEFIFISIGKTFDELLEILPIILFVFFLMFLFNMFIKPEHIVKHLGKESGLKGWFYTIIGSIFVMGPPYILFPMFGEFQKHGMKNSLISVFMNNRNINIIFIPVMVHYFGLTYSIILISFMFLFSILNGIIIGKILDK